MYLYVLRFSFSQKGAVSVPLFPVVGCNQRQENHLLWPSTVISVSDIQSSRWVAIETRKKLKECAHTHIQFCSFSSQRCLLTKLKSKKVRTDTVRTRMLNRDVSEETETHSCLRPPSGVWKWVVLPAKGLKLGNICLDNEHDMVEDNS